HGYWRPRDRVGAKVVARNSLLLLLLAWGVHGLCSLLLRWAVRGRARADLVIGHEERDTLAIKREAHLLEMREVRAAADLDIPLDGGSAECVEQPPGVFVRNKSVPFTTNDGDRRLNLRGIVGK